MFGSGAFFLLFFLAMMGVTLGGIVFWVWAFIDVVQREDWMFRSGDRMIWALVVGLGGPIGAVIYFVVGRPKVARRF